MIRVTVILGLGFLRNSDETLSPGSANKALIHYWRKGPAKDLCIAQYGPYLAADAGERVLPLPHGTYADTFDAAMQAWAVMYQVSGVSDLSTVTVDLIAHPLQRPRARFLFGLIFPNVEAPKLPRNTPVCPGSEQTWTRTWTGYLLYELVVAWPMSMVKCAPLIVRSWLSTRTTRR